MTARFLNSPSLRSYLRYRISWVFQPMAQHPYPTIVSPTSDLIRTQVPLKQFDMLLFVTSHQIEVAVRWLTAKLRFLFTRSECVIFSLFSARQAVMERPGWRAPGSVTSADRGPVVPESELSDASEESSSNTDSQTEPRDGHHKYRGKFSLVS